MREVEDLGQNHIVWDIWLGKCRGNMSPTRNSDQNSKPTCCSLLCRLSKLHPCWIIRYEVRIQDVTPLLCARAMMWKTWMNVRSWERKERRGFVNLLLRVYKGGNYPGPVAQDVILDEVVTNDRLSVKVTHCDDRRYSVCIYATWCQHPRHMRKWPDFSLV